MIMRVLDKVLNWILCVLVILDLIFIVGYYEKEKKGRIYRSYIKEMQRVKKMDKVKVIKFVKDESI